MANLEVQNNPFTSLLMVLAADPEAIGDADPAAGQMRLVAGDDLALYWLDETGNATPVSGAGGDVATDALWNAKGDLAVGTGSDTAIRRAVGSNGQVLTADSAETDGVKWATPSTGGFPTYVQALQSSQVAMSADNTWTDLTGASVSLVAGTWLVMGKVHALYAGTAIASVGMRVTDGTNHYASGELSMNAGNPGMNGNHWGGITTPWAVVTLGSTTTVKLQGITSTGTSNTVFRVALGVNGVGNNAAGILALRVA